MLYIIYMEKEIKTIDSEIVQDRNMFYQKASNITKRHCEVCDCLNDLIPDKMLKVIEAMNKSEEYLEKAKSLGYKKWTIDNCNTDAVRSKAIEVLSEEHKVCSKEHVIIKDIIHIYGKKYPLDDPEVFLIVSSLIELRLTAHRMQLESNYSGVLQEVETKSGSVYYKINPVERVKKEYHEAVINAVSQLNKIMVGEKTINTNINANIEVDWDNILQKIDENEDR